MIRTMAVGLWAGLVATGSSYATGVWLARQPPAPAGPVHGSALEHRKSRTINVPVIAAGVVQGYIVVQFAYTLDAGAAGARTASPDAFLLDEAFRVFYADQGPDLQKLGRFDLGRIAHDLRDRVNTRVGDDVLKEVLVQDLTYVGKAGTRPAGRRTNPAP